MIHTTLSAKLQSINASTEIVAPNVVAKGKSGFRKIRVSRFVKTSPKCYVLSERTCAKNILKTFFVFYKGTVFVHF